MSDESAANIPPAPKDRNAARANALFRALKSATAELGEAIAQRDIADMANDTRRLNALQRDVDELLARLADPAIKNAFEKPLGEAYAQGFGQSGFGAGEASINKEQIKALADGFVETAQKSLAKSQSNLPYIASRVLTPAESDSVRELAIEATARGLTSKQFAKILRDRGPVASRAYNEDGVSWVQITESRRIPADVYADTLARTMTYHAANRGTVDRAQKAGIRTVIVVKNPGTIDFCLDLEGKVYALDSAAAARYEVPLLGDCPNGGPPFHPNCRHVIAPFPMVARQIGKVPTAPADVLTRDRGPQARTDAQAAFKRRLDDDPTKYADVIGESAARRGFGGSSAKLKGRDKALAGKSIPGLRPGQRENFGPANSGALSEDVHLFKRMQDSGVASRKEFRQIIADSIRGGTRSGNVVRNGNRLIYYNDETDWATIVDPELGLVVTAFPVKAAGQNWQTDYVEKYR